MSLPLIIFITSVLGPLLFGIGGYLIGTARTGVPRRSLVTANGSSIAAVDQLRQLQHDQEQQTAAWDKQLISSRGELAEKEAVLDERLQEQRVLGQRLEQTEWELSEAIRREQQQRAEQEQDHRELQAANDALTRSQSALEQKIAQARQELSEAIRREQQQRAAQDQNQRELQAANEALVRSHGALEQCSTQIEQLQRRVVASLVSFQNPFEEELQDLRRKLVAHEVELLALKQKSFSSGQAAAPAYDSEPSPEDLARPLAFIRRLQGVKSAVITDQDGLLLAGCGQHTVDNALAAAVVPLLDFVGIARPLLHLGAIRSVVATDEHGVTLCCLLAANERRGGALSSMLLHHPDLTSPEITSAYSALKMFFDRSSSAPAIPIFNRSIEG